MEIFDSVLALLFVADEPVRGELLARTLNVTEGQVEQAIEILQGRLYESGPLQIIRLAGGWQLCTKPECAEIVAAFLKPQRQRLGRSLMEVLAIVAYRQPITLAEIDVARGVQSDYSLRQLLERRLVEEVGRKEGPGRPILYGTTQQFLHQFGLNDLQQLPELSAEMTDLLAVKALAQGTDIEAEDSEDAEASSETKDELDEAAKHEFDHVPDGESDESPQDDLKNSPEDHLNEPPSDEVESLEPETAAPPAGSTSVL